jgi:hypothetical protein
MKEQIRGWDNTKSAKLQAEPRDRESICGWVGQAEYVEFDTWE